jgi:hypothetical protein
MNRSDETTAAAVSADELTMLERILVRQLDGHNRMLACMERNREARRRQHRFPWTRSPRRPASPRATVSRRWPGSFGPPSRK